MILLFAVLAVFFFVTTRYHYTINSNPPLIQQAWAHSQEGEDTQPGRGDGGRGHTAGDMMMDTA